ncbi:hypothetical protein EDD80_10363 [Anseongella ginsenosidimutans]|uniref:Uncharacterized protein n=1 Tax=Anseongella ginsenosidimutans TaxID=496056 RepID=A0A4V2UTX7_9SPHI|nr:hypothetical protein EDD80_10363 [Anseongella ginsenosidimutans]
MFRLLHIIFLVQNISVPGHVLLLALLARFPPSRRSGASIALFRRKFAENSVTNKTTVI